MKKYRDLIGEDITIFKKFYHKLENAISLSSNGKFIISHEKMKGLRDASKYILSKRIQEMSEIEKVNENMIVEEKKDDNS
tara:strand:+ start:2271 stop:2510 length:240 start_codon:yes stop_codon:yes gene_type:complete